MFKTSVAEISNSIFQYGGVRNVWVIYTTRASIHHNNINGAFKFAIDLDASSGPFTMIHDNWIHNNSYQAVFIEQGTQFSVVTRNTLGPGRYTQSQYLLLYNVISSHVISYRQITT